MNFVSLQLGLRRAFPPQCLSQIRKLFLKGKKNNLYYIIHPFSNCSTLNWDILLKTFLEADTPRLSLHLAFLFFPSQF